MKSVFARVGCHDPCPARSRSRSRSRNRKARQSHHRSENSISHECRSGSPLNIGIGFGIGWASSRRDRRKSGNRGTSLAELLVVLALLSVMVLVAAQLVVHSIQLLDATGRAVRNPLVVHVTSRLRRDVQEAAAVQNAEWSWSEDPLVLIHHDGSRVRVELEGGNLVREKTGVMGEPGDQRVILRGVTGWWWRSPFAGVVDINITYLVNPSPERHVSRDPGYGLERRKENLRFAIRGSGGGTRW